jgi:hypothetical protein
LTFGLWLYLQGPTLILYSSFFILVSEGGDRVKGVLWRPQTMVAGAVLRAGKVNYDSVEPGVWLGVDGNGVGKLSIGDASSGIRWDGGGLVIEGDLTVSFQTEETNQVKNAVVRHRTSATPAPGFGSGIEFRADTTEGQDQPMGSVMARWSNPNHATRAGRISLVVNDHSGWLELISGTMKRIDLNAPTLFHLPSTSFIINEGGTEDATEAAWVEVESGGVTGYLRIYATP